MRESVDFVELELCELWLSVLGACLMCTRTGGWGGAWLFLHIL